jgi:thymidylate synthase ThyX
VQATTAVSTRHAEDFYQRVLVGYGDDSVAELAGAHLAVEEVSMLAAKAIEDSRIGISPLEKSTRYVRFDRRGRDGGYLYYRGAELEHPEYAPAMDRLFDAYSALLPPLLDGIRRTHPMQPDETERGWKSATRAKAFDLLRGLLPAGALTNLGLYGNGRAFEYLLTKMSAHELPECRQLAVAMHEELAQVIPAFVGRALDARHGAPAADRLTATRENLRGLAPELRATPPSGPAVRLLEYDFDAERKVVAAALFPHTNAPLDHVDGIDVEDALVAMMGDRANRRQRVPRAFEHAGYLFEIVANFGAYRDLQRHRMLTQDRQLLTTELGFDPPDGIEQHELAASFRSAMDSAAESHQRLERDLGRALAQYAVPMGYRMRWYFRVNLREIYHLCELRTSPQGHPDYRWIAQEMFRLVRDVHPRLASYARFVDLSPGDELERRQSERRLDEKLRRLTGG